LVWWNSQKKKQKGLCQPHVLVAKFSPCWTHHL
jgi:hypothetical protein